MVKSQQEEQQKYGKLEECSHGQLLRALHQEIITYGLTPGDFLSPQQHLDHRQRLTTAAQEAAENFDPASSPTGTTSTSPTPTPTPLPLPPLSGNDNGDIIFVQSATGAFPPLRYIRHHADEVDCVEVEIRALAMFNDLIVNATATPAGRISRSDRESISRDGSTPATPSSYADGVVRRSYTFRVDRWLSKTPGHEEADRTKFGDEHQTRDAKALSAGTPSSQETSTADRPHPIPIHARDEFRSAVCSGLLLHLCRPSGQFADLFGLEESLRWRVLGVLGARDLVTFGLASRAAALSSISDYLWAPLVAAEFSEREQHAVLLLRSSSPPPPLQRHEQDTNAFGAVSVNGDKNHQDEMPSKTRNFTDGHVEGSTCVHTGDGAGGGAIVKDAEGGEGALGDRNAGHGESRTKVATAYGGVGEGNRGSADVSVSEGGDGVNSVGCHDSGGVGEGSDCNVGIPESGGIDSDNGDGIFTNNDDDNTGKRGKVEGASRRLYAKLHNARVRRAAIAADHRRRMTILEMSALGRLGRTWGLYPWAPYLPRGPYHTPGPGPGPGFTEYNWGPGISGGGAGAGGHLQGVGGGGSLHPTWGGGWRRPGSWRLFGGGGGGMFCGGGLGAGAGGGLGSGNGGGIPPLLYGGNHGAGRRGRGRSLGHVTGIE